ncbi:MAG: hypothetical protein O2960_27370 [Verrucomicrobia bacterium]|nr:hypothetical protein [Verrucomicrobiota bacterium]
MSRKIGKDRFKATAPESKTMGLRYRGNVRPNGSGYKPAAQGFPSLNKKLLSDYLSEVREVPKTGNPNGSNDIMMLGICFLTLLMIGVIGIIAFVGFISWLDSLLMKRLKSGFEAVFSLF